MNLMKGDDGTKGTFLIAHDIYRVFREQWTEGRIDKLRWNILLNGPLHNMLIILPIKRISHHEENTDGVSKSSPTPHHPQ